MMEKAAAPINTRLHGPMTWVYILTTSPAKAAAGLGAGLGAPWSRKAPSTTKHTASTVEAMYPKLKSNNVCFRVGRKPVWDMRSTVHRLFHALMSTAVGIQPIRAIRKPSETPSPQSIAGRSGASYTGPLPKANPKATRVEINSTAPMILMRLSSTPYLPKANTTTVPTSRSPVIRGKLPTPNRLSKNPAVTAPTAAATKNKVPRVSTAYPPITHLLCLAYPSRMLVPVTFA